jgi:predicted HAD superfamily Cof-like phosphohydrolase
MIENVLEFNRRFGLPLGGVDHLTTNVSVQEYRIKFLQEELAELVEALAAGDKVKVFDALLDLVYVAQGTALFAGINVPQWTAGMAAVHHANMAKIRVARPENSKRGSGFDVIKPPGWIGPESHLEEILRWYKTEAAMPQDRGPA